MLEYKDLKEKCRKELSKLSLTKEEEEKIVLELLFLVDLTFDYFPEEMDKNQA